VPVRRWGRIGGRQADFFYVQLHFVNMSEPIHVRKIEDEKRQFKEEWTTKYFMRHFNGAAVCLICLLLC